eukprot:TRINITY_DN2380_c0_g2_i3.p1 TRINITY_DN2380_c0_g2~~TRINITY_DN2380_c0_g2_i3.p1  ORF type:complete len:1717 (-),score=408.08 TRINITY_DN2380_c0_g2_i3:3428-8578(-)
MPSARCMEQYGMCSNKADSPACGSVSHRAPTVGNATAPALVWILSSGNTSKHFNTQADKVSNCMTMQRGDVLYDSMSALDDVMAEAQLNYPLRIMIHKRCAMKATTKKYKSLLYIGLIITAVVVIIAVLYATRQAAPMVNMMRDPRVPVRTVEVEKTPFRRELSLLGTARAKRRAQVAAEVSGNIVWISENCEPGRKVQKGEKLVQIDNRPYTIALEQAEAAYAEAEAALKLRAITNQTEEAKLQESREELEAAKNELDRKQRLFEKGVVSASEVDAQQSSYSSVRKTYLDVLSNVNSAKALYKQDEAQLAMKKAEREKAALDLERTTLVAPFAGEVASRAVDVGNHISANTVAFESVAFDTVVVDVQVPSGSLEVVREDATAAVRDDVTVTVQARDGRISRNGRLTHLSPSAESDTRLFAAEIYVDNPPDLPPILPGQFVETIITETEPRQAVVIPYIAMTQDSDGLYVYTVQEPDEAAVASAGSQQSAGQVVPAQANTTADAPAPTVSKKYVQILWEQGEAAVVQGLESGVTLVVSGQEDLVEGAEVQVIGTGAYAGQATSETGSRLADDHNATSGAVGVQGQEQSAVRKLAEFSVNNPVTVNLIMISILVMGVVLYKIHMPKEVFPEFSENQITVTTVYPGASAEEIEKNVTLKIEEAVSDLDYLEDISSTTQEGLSMVRIKISPEAKNLPKLVSDAQQAIDQIDEFPDDADDPVVKEMQPNIPVITVSLYGEINLRYLKDLVDELEDEIQTVSGVSDVRISGLPEREIQVEVEPEALDRYGLTLSEISNAIREHNFDLPGGTLPTSQGEFLVRTVGKSPTAKGLEDIPLMTTATGGELRLGEVAQVRDWFEDESSLGRFSLQRAVNLTVTKTRSGDAIKVSEAVRNLVDGYRDRLPATVGIGVFNDTSVYVKNRLETLSSSGVQGLIMVFAFLLLMLNTRVAAMVTLGIPVSFLGAIIIMAYAGMTMNMMSMFALIVVLGLVVDDAVVIGENVYRHYEAGLSPREAAIKGASEVSWPVVAAVATTVAAFMPLLLIPGTMGVFLGVIPKVVIFALLISLLEALVILPAHMADYLPEKPPEPSNLRKKINKGIDGVINRYGALVNRCLEWRYVFMAGALGLTAVIIAYSVLHIPFRLFHDFEGTQFYVTVEAPPSSALEDTEDLVKHVERVVAQSIPETELASLVTNVGFLMGRGNSSEQGENLAQMIVELNDLGRGRERPLKAVMADVRKAVQPYALDNTITVQAMQSGPGGDPIYVLVSGAELDVLRDISSKIRSFIEEVPGTSDVKDNLEAGKPELQVQLKPHAYALGLTDSMVAGQLRDAFIGSESSKFQTSKEDIDVRVKLPESRTNRIDSLTHFKVTLPSGRKVQLSEVATIAKNKGISTIVREDRKRALIITGELNQDLTTSKMLSEAVKKKFANIPQQYPGYTVETERGEVEDINESMAALSTAFLLGLLLIYFILGTQFKSYLQPFVVMAAIPFGIDGVLLGHILMGQDLGLLSMIGLVALSGIVVNDSLVLVDFVNQRRREGAPRRSSLVEAGMVRLRPVVLTSVTTMGGLFFLAFFASGQARFLAPMAISIFFGLMASTVITLLIVPCLYAILDDISYMVTGKTTAGRQAAKAAHAQEGGQSRKIRCIRDTVFQIGLPKLPVQSIPLKAGINTALLKRERSIASEKSHHTHTPHFHRRPGVYSHPGVQLHHGVWVRRVGDPLR